MSEKKKNSSSSSKGTVHVVRTSFDQILEKNGFRLTNVIGNGSYAKVKYARFVSLFFSLRTNSRDECWLIREGEYTSKSGDSKKIAAKIIDKRRAPSDFVNRFLPRELEIYQRLNHPNIVKVYHIMEINPRIYIFMELAEGGDLLDFIKVCRLIYFIFSWMGYSFYCLMLKIRNEVLCRAYMPDKCSANWLVPSDIVTVYTSHIEISNVRIFFWTRAIMWSWPILDLVEVVVS